MIKISYASVYTHGGSGTPTASQHTKHLTRKQAAGCDHEITNWSQPLQRPHVREAEAGAITNLQLWSGRPNSGTRPAGLSPATPKRHRFRVSGGNPITNQATWRLAGPGQDSYIRFPDWSDGVTSANAKKKTTKTRKHEQVFLVL